MSRSSYLQATYTEILKKETVSVEHLSVPMIDMKSPNFGRVSIKSFDFMKTSLVGF